MSNTLARDCGKRDLVVTRTHTLTFTTWVTLIVCRTQLRDLEMDAAVLELVHV